MFFGARAQSGATKVQLARSDADRFALCADLGYRASDLLQSNVVVWVEGPSDRLYFLWWLKALAPDLIEGLHFSVMHYGGRLLSHLSVEDSRVKEFVSLRRLNRNIVILIDSDRAKPTSTLNGTKQRVISEMSASGGVVWVTEGREIENYVAADVLEAAIRSVHSNYTSSVSQNKYRHVFAGIEKPDKVQIARAATEKMPQLDHLDLRSQLEIVAAYIRQANRADDLLIEGPQV